MLAERIEVVIGVDTHKHTHTVAVVVAATGAVLAEKTVNADPAGYDTLVELANQHGPLRAWAMEGSGGYGAGRAVLLVQRGELVIELDRPARPARRAGARVGAAPDGVRLTDPTNPDSLAPRTGHMTLSVAPLAPTDEQLMQALADGHPEAIRTIYDRPSRLVYAQARKICAEDGLAEDTTQEVFLAL
jgi:hypothetical protein